MKIFSYFTAFYLLSFPLSALPPEQNDIAWNYESTYLEGLLFVHPLVNYDYHPQWYMAYETQLFAGNSLMLNYGSVSTRKLMSDAAVRINTDLGGGWRFRGEGNLREYRHEDTAVQAAFLGLEKTIHRPLAVHLTANPSYDKENLDLAFGISLFSRDRREYLDLALTMEDFLYTEKNTAGGTSLQTPLGLQWRLRIAGERWHLASGGNIRRGFRREFAGDNAFQTFHRQRLNRHRSRLYFAPAEPLWLVIGAEFYNFQEGKRFINSNFDYNYENAMQIYLLQVLLPYRERFGLRLQIHYLRQKARSNGYREHRFQRRDIMPAVFGEWQIARHAIEAGYMFTRFNWDFQKIYAAEHFGHTDLNDKLKLGWTYTFESNARLQFSVSHQLNLGGFGGGNVQYLMFF